MPLPACHLSIEGVPGCRAGTPQFRWGMRILGGAEEQNFFTAYKVLYNDLTQIGRSGLPFLDALPIFGRLAAQIWAGGQI